MSLVKMPYTVISETLTVFFQSRRDNMFMYMVNAFLYIPHAYYYIDLLFYYYHSRCVNSLLSR